MVDVWVLPRLKGYIKGSGLHLAKKGCDGLISSIFFFFFIIIYIVYMWLDFLVGKVV